MRRNERAALKLARVRTGLLEDAPFFGTLLMHLTLKEDKACKTTWTDAKHIGYNPEYIEELLDIELKGLLAQTALHLGLGHLWRQTGRNPQRWKRAGDLAINGALLSSGYRLPKGSLTDTQYEGLAAELIYAKLEDEAKNEQPPLAPPAPADSGTPEGSAEGPDVPQDGQGPASESSDPKDAGTPAPESGMPDSSGADESVPGEFRQVDETAKSEHEWQMAVQAAARTQGRLPGHMARLVGMALQARVAWREVLWDLLQQATGAGDYSWSTPNRRWLAAGLYMPSLVGVQAPSLVFARDTSLSVSDTYVEAYNAEIQEVVDSFKPETAFIVDCDTVIQQVIELVQGESPDNWDAKGNGGTSFVPVFDWVKEHDLEPSAVVYFTDLEGGFPSESPPYPVYWVVPGGSSVKPPFGEVIHMKMD